MNKPKFTFVKKLIASSALVFTLLTASGVGLVTNSVIDTIGKANVAYAAEEYMVVESVFLKEENKVLVIKCSEWIEGDSEKNFNKDNVKITYINSEGEEEELKIEYKKKNYFEADFICND